MTASPTTSRRPAGPRRLGQVRRWSTPSAEIVSPAGPGKRVARVRLWWRIAPYEDGRYAVALAALLRSPPPGSPAPLAEHLESLGAVITTGATAGSCYLDLQAPRETCHLALRLAVRALASATVDSAAVDSAAIEAARTVLAYQADRRGHDPRLRASDAFRAARATPGSPLVVPPTGTGPGLRGLEPALVRTSLRTLATAYRPSLIVVGDPDLEPYADDLAILDIRPGDPPGGSPPDPATAALRPAPPAEVLVDTGAPGQAFLLWGTACPMTDAFDYAVLELASHVLGGWSGARWQRLFRQEKGYTYGVHATVAAWRLGTGDVGLTHVGMTVAPDLLGPARELLAAQADRYRREGPTVDEIVQAATQLVRGEALHYDSADHLMQRMAPFLQAGLPVDFLARRIRALRSVDVERFRAAFARLFHEPTTVVLAARPRGDRTPGGRG